MNARQNRYCRIIPAASFKIPYAIMLSVSALVTYVNIQTTKSLLSLKRRIMSRMHTITRCVNQDARNTFPRSRDTLKIYNKKYS